MKKIFYPAIFHPAEEGGFWVTFPDLPECITEGDNIEEAYNMAKEALELVLTDYIKEQKKFPKPSDISNIIIKEDERVMQIQFNR